MGDRPSLSLSQLAQLYAAQMQLPTTDPNANIQPSGRYFGQRFVPNNLDQMALPSHGLPPDRNTFDPNVIMQTWRNFRQEDL